MLDYKQFHKTAIAELGQYKEFEISDNNRAAMIRAALSNLSERDSFILEQLFINTQKRKKEEYVAKVMSKYELSKTELYRLRDGALTNYCFSMLIGIMGGKMETRSTD